MAVRGPVYHAITTSTPTSRPHSDDAAMTVSNRMPSGSASGCGWMPTTRPPRGVAAPATA